MNILVCVKQVPSSNAVEVDPVSGTLKRDGVDSKLNPYDLYALEAAVRMRAAVGGEVTVITMGPPQAAEIIKEAFMLGADHGVVVSDRKFAGSDVLATSRTISQAIKAWERGRNAAADKDGAGRAFDIIFCGKQTTDGDTAQVGAELAEFLGIPHVTNVLEIIEFAADGVVLDCDFPCYIARSKVKYPCLLAVEKNVAEPRLPSYKLKQSTQNREIKFISLNDFADNDPLHYGQNGSPTQVIRIFPPESDKCSENWHGDSDELSGKLYSYLDGNKFLQKIR